MEWIKAEDKMPESGQDVLGWVQGQILPLNYDLGVWESSHVIFQGRFEPEYWMPLPASPQHAQSNINYPDEEE